MKRRRVVHDTPATPHFDFIYGRYRLSSWAIPYFSTLMPIKQAAASLRLTADLPGSDDVMWRLDELYQREVDWPRVERQIIPYLHAVEQPQFFNALTIALLPIGRSLSNVKQAFDSTREWNPPRLDDPDRFGRRLTVGPITCGYWLHWSDFSQAEARTGQIRWNPDEVFAVALDGQHRLAAIQEFVQHPSISDERLQDTSVPVIFVTLDPRFGYETRSQESLVDVLRVVFIDLNKHAKIPSRARQILLDDKDPTSVCVRALVGESVTGDTADLNAQPRRMPLSLVDWHTEQAKFDEGPYVTTILTLDWAISALLGAKPVHDFMDYGALRRQVTALSKWLDIDLSDAHERLNNLEGVKLQPFSYAESQDNDELQKIETAFQTIWNPIFVNLLTDFAPYRDLIRVRETNESFTLDFANWYRLYYQKKKDRYRGRATTEYRHLLKRLESKPEPVGETRLEDALAETEASKTGLAFNVVFQRAYFLAFREWIMVEDSHLDELRTSDEDDAFDDDGGDADETVTVESTSLAARIQMRAREFVRAMNQLVEKEPGVLQVDCLFDTNDGERQRFWLGTLMAAEGNIDFTQGASIRAREIIFWAVAMRTYIERVQDGRPTEFGDFWSEVLDAQSKFTSRIFRSLKRFADKESASAGSRILTARDEEFDREQSREEARKRMEWLWNAANS